MQSEYLHLLLVPVLTHALPVAALGLVLALVFRSRGATRLALGLIALSSAMVWPAVHYGRASYDQVKAMIYRAGVDWLDVHRWRAEHFAWVFYATGLVALLALLAPDRWSKLRRTLTWLALVAALGATAVGSYIAYPGGRVRHKELRQGPPSAIEVQRARHAYGDDQS